MDNGFKSFSICAEIITFITESLFNELLSPPIRIGTRDIPIPSSREIAKFCYPSQYDIICSIFRMLDKKINIEKLTTFGDFAFTKENF